MRSLLTITLSICILIDCTTVLWAQEEAPGWFYRAWQTEDGLPDNSIAGIAQTPDGYLWVATNGGAMRFNGVQFSPLPLRDIPKLPSRQVRSMLVDRSGSLWLGMERGPLIRIGDESFQVFTRDKLFKKRVMSMVDNPIGQTWIAYANAVCLIEGDEVTRMSDKERIPAGDEASLACDSDGQVWLANGGKLGRLSPQGFELIHDFVDDSLRIAKSSAAGILLTSGSDLIKVSEDGERTKLTSLPNGCAVNTIFENRNGEVWIGTQHHGLLWLKDGSVKRVSTSLAWVDCITEDREGYLWAGTRGGGLNLIRPRAVQFIDEADGLPFSVVRSTACDSSGRIWAVSQDGRLAVKRGNHWELYSQLGEKELVNCVAADANGGVWVGTRSRGLVSIDRDQSTRYRVRDGLSSSVVRSLLTATNGDVWIATDSPGHLNRLRDGKITKLEHTGNLAVIRALAESADGTIWTGSSNGRLSRVDGDNLVNESALDGPLMLSIRTMHATPDGSLWIGYAGDGLGHLKDRRFRMITTEDGLYDNYISQILSDGAGAIWLAANRGLFQVNLEELLAVSAEPEPSGRLRCRVFGPSDGVPSIQPSRDYAPSASRRLDGRLYLPTHSGIIEVDPNKIREKAMPPPVTLEKVILDKRTVGFYHKRSMLRPEVTAAQTDLSSPAPRLDLPPDHEKLVVHFAALSLASPENVHLRYRLQPIDQEWVEIESQRSVTFPRLPAGDYEFQVIACNNVGVWNEEGATLGIGVHPFFWETWWFRVGGGLLTAFAAGGLVFFGLRRKHDRQLQGIAAKRALEQERSRIARDIHDDLGASLTRITLLSQTAQSPKEAMGGEGVLDQIHTTSRHLMRSMEEVVWAVNPEHDTFDALANYLSTYGQGFLSVAGIRCRLEMPLALPDLPLSAQIRHNLFLAFKEALNNAVKHADASEVRISLEVGEDAFSLRVEDDGNGIDPDASPSSMRPTSGNGVTNMKERMDEIGGTCNLDSRHGQGATIEFKVPFNLNDRT